MTIKEKFKDDLDGFVDYLVNERELCIVTPYQYALDLVQTLELDPMSVLDLDDNVEDIRSDDSYVFVSNYDTPFSFSSVDEFYDMIDRDYYSYELHSSELDEQYEDEYDNSELNPK